jgi:hypothetical protein
MPRGRNGRWSLSDWSSRRRNREPCAGFCWLGTARAVLVLQHTGRRWVLVCRGRRSRKVEIRDVVWSVWLFAAGGKLWQYRQSISSGKGSGLNPCVQLVRLSSCRCHCPHSQDAPMQPARANSQRVAGACGIGRTALIDGSHSLP